MPAPSAQPEPPLTAFRLASWDTPFWVGPNRSGGRFNHRGDGPVQYWSLHPLTPWAEYCRGEGRRTPGAFVELRLRLWVARIGGPLTPVGFEEATAFGLRPEDLIADDHRPCRDLGARLLRDRAARRALVVPSAALPGTRNLVLFGPRVLAPFDVSPLDEVDVPAAVAADAAQPLHTLGPVIRHHGETHAEYEAWRAGRAFSLTEPATPLPASA